MPPVFIPTPAPGLGYGGWDYGYSPYGHGSFPRPPVAVDSGYGGYPYGLHSYGSIDTDPPRLTGAVSLSGTLIELYFSETILIDSTLTDVSSYTITPILGSPATVLSVIVGASNPYGATSVLITHTGTTLGGRYTLAASLLLQDINGMYLLPGSESVSLLTLGDVPTYTITPTDGEHLRLDFSESMLPETDFSPGIEDVTAYGITTTYPVSMTVLNATHPYTGDDSKVRLKVQGMTSASYTMSVSPATAITYDGSILPSASTEFTGSSIGTGTSTAGLTGLLLSKNSGVSYGWQFADLTGKILPNSSFRIDVTFDSTAATYTPSLYDTTLATLLVSDGVVQTTINLIQVGGLKTLEVISGGVNQQFPAQWNTGSCKITLIRNQKASLYAVLLNDTPLFSNATSGFTGIASIPSGCRFTLSPNYAVVQFPITEILFTSSQTIFSNAWNFLHGVSLVFIGSSALTRPAILTKRGPLVKDWGDSTPATIQDVSVRVNSVAVSISSVNPYIGLITPSIPIPLMPVGSMTVDVDYNWMSNPVMEIAGLNTYGLVLNKWDLPQGHHSSSTTSSLGVADTMRFPMGLVLAPIQKQKPKWISYRHIGFERAYSALLNSPTTLLLNQSPHKASQGYEQITCGTTVNTFSGDNTNPTEEGWTLYGVDTGYAGLHYWTLIDNTTGGFEIGQGAFYYVDTAIDCPSVYYMAARLAAVQWESDGVFTGLGFGAHDDLHLYLVGLLEINGVKHLGVLQTPQRPDLETSWDVQPALSGVVLSSNTIQTTISNLLYPGSTFQILNGLQAGVYTVADCGVSDTGEITINESFPVNPEIEGGRDVTLHPEIDYTKVDTIRFQATDGSLQLFVQDYTSDLIIVLGSPALTNLLIPTDEQGGVFFGSLSREATNESQWYFVQSSIQSVNATSYFKGIIVAAEMSRLPQDDENHPWYLTEDFGYSKIDTGNVLLLKSTSGQANINTTFGYARQEPFLIPQNFIDLDATFKLDTSNLAYGDSEIRILNGEREIVFATLLYKEGSTPYRRLIADMPAVSISGIRDPVYEGWVKSGNATLTVPDYRGITLSGSNTLYSKVLGDNSDASESLVLESTVLVSGSGYSLNNGPVFGARVGLNHRDIGLQFTNTPTRIRLVSNGGSVQAYAHNWTDGAEHTYRIQVDIVAGIVTLVVDDIALSPTVLLTAFTPLGSTRDVYFGSLGAIQSNATWTSCYAHRLPDASTLRTVGILLRGGDPEDINGWEIPRTDSSTDTNDSINAIVEPMDWLSYCQFRIRLDPGWGVTVYRPDLPPPPYYDGENATEYTEPSAGWINVNQKNLPRAGGTFGRVAFGFLRPESLSQQRWQDVRYHVYSRENPAIPGYPGMVLNRYNVLTSGELNNDLTIEIVEITSLTSRIISLAPAHIYADRVFTLVVNNVVLPNATWSFDKDSQSITLTTALASDHESVTVSFAAGNPVTNTYLCSQPLLQGNVILNDSTPPYVLSQVGQANRAEVAGTTLNDPSDLIGSVDTILNNGNTTIEFTSEAIYEDIEICEVDDGGDEGLISSLCDGPGIDEGWISTEISGGDYSDLFSAEWETGASSLSDGYGGFDQLDVLYFSGGNFDGGDIGPGSPILYPSYPAISTPDGGAVIQGVRFQLECNAVLINGVETDLEDSYTDLTDSIPATYAGDSVQVNPNGTPVSDGACVALLITEALYTRLGPWGGDDALAQSSYLYGTSSVQLEGIPASGIGFECVGGAELAEDTYTTISIA